MSEANAMYMQECHLPLHGRQLENYPAKCEEYENGLDSGPE